jgi:hypothetical protein
MHRKEQEIKQRKYVVSFRSFRCVRKHYLNLVSQTRGPPVYFMRPAHLPYFSYRMRHATLLNTLFQCLFACNFISSKQQASRPKLHWSCSALRRRRRSKHFGAGVVKLPVVKLLQRGLLLAYKFSRTVCSGPSIKRAYYVVIKDRKNMF